VTQQHARTHAYRSYCRCGQPPGSRWSSSGRCPYPEICLRFDPTSQRWASLRSRPARFGHFQTRNPYDSIAHCPQARAIALFQSPLHSPLLCHSLSSLF
jgi:hypothetical protein